MEQDVLVSVVIPTYSRNESLSKAIDSVLNQTFKNIEVIIVDDNPADSEWRKVTEQIVAKYRDNNRIRYIQNPKNLGGGMARNVGISHAKGEYIAFLDDDDEYLTEKIQKQLSVFLNSKSSKLALVYCYAKFVNRDGSITYSDRRTYRGHCLYEAMEQNCISATSQWMVSKSAIESVGGFPDVPCKQDSQTILKLLKVGYEIDVVPEELSLYSRFVIGNKISGNGKKNILGEELYRTECRKLYYLLKDWQIINVEYQFAERFYALYRSNKMKEDYLHQWQIMKKLNRRRAFVYEIKRIWHKVHKS